MQSFVTRLKSTQLFFNGFNGLFTTHVQYYIKKNEYKNEIRWREQDLQP